MLNSETLNDVSQARDAAQAVLDGLEHYRPEAPGLLAEPLAAYAAIISAVNQRLRAAQVLLAKGRREEAIHTCDAEPNLLDCVAALDSCDQAIEAWLPAIEELGLTRPQRLLSDLAEDLGAAYDLRHQMESLMRTHRLLAISRGPIEHRVATLRRIVQTDPGNAQWLEDLVEYERACKALLQDVVVKVVLDIGDSAEHGQVSQFVRASTVQQARAVGRQADGHANAAARE